MVNGEVFIVTQLVFGNCKTACWGW